MTVAFFPIVHVLGEEKLCYDSIVQDWRIDTFQADAWVDERVKNVVEGIELFIGYPEEPSRQSKIIIEQAETEFLRNYLYPNMPLQVKAEVEKAEFEDLRRGFVKGHKRSRWFEAAGGILCYQALETLKSEGDSLKNLVGFEARLYALYIRSVKHSRSERHPDIKTYVRGALGAGTFNHLNEEIIQQAKEKYGTQQVKGLIEGSSYWKR
ncbi:hypothetical protein D3C75_659500 [compost metagenome]